ncbi:neurogenic locus Notch [Brachionus plicatilis]|uniref:Neurogenic locus Notch n=1 Tax=Brachionus plicatilis TaxID=10195 RepID=A0A3M7T1F0_BRAPC|nr:neurogenic locus Notch [Brachionus plicatilis]
MKFIINFVSYAFVLSKLTYKTNGLKNALMCARNLCENNGTCIDTNAGYSCFCSNGYIGINCEKTMNKSQPSKGQFNLYRIISTNPCKNGGRPLSPELNKIICHCKSGTTGRFCEILIDVCASNPCRSRGMCQSFINLYACSCFPGYTGSNCEIKLNLCLSDPCQNNGKCIDYSSYCACECQDGFTGPLCKNKIDECSGSPCKNATCVPLIPSGYRCETKQDYCSSNPCVHGTCKTGALGYECICSSEYAGKRCESKNSEYA